ncbi:Aste57867_2547 [Aphanomyces stellatus]|uniref:Aste57867_2547 protein n=1 Tax=Aphanomyces stellatus TaxID=120398 RepID=A0A485K8W8_9STRA|nr:hypothetical protein As57867_002540 [Aphanomyces stellatus]VFT79744.1 Aste57867_2547 [Aphanomyces stellatus]
MDEPFHSLSKTLSMALDASAIAVFGCAPLLSRICAFQRGRSGAVIAVQQCPIIHAIYGRLIQCSNVSSSQDERPASVNLSVNVHMDNLEAVMETRRTLVDAVLNHPVNADVLFHLATNCTQTRDVVVEFAAFFGRLDLLKRLCTTMKRQLSTDPRRDPQFDAFDRILIPSNAHLLRQLAAFHGYLDVLVFLNTTSYSSLTSRGGTKLSYSDIEVAAERHHVAVLEYLVDGAKQVCGRKPLFRRKKFFDANYFGFRHPLEATKTSMATKGIRRIHAADAATDDGHVEVAACLIRHGAPHANEDVCRNSDASASCLERDGPLDATLPCFC